MQQNDPNLAENSISGDLLDSGQVENLNSE